MRKDCLDTTSPATGGGTGGGTGEVLEVAEVLAFIERLQVIDPQANDVQRIDQIRALETLQHAAVGAQAELVVDFDGSQRAEQAAAGARPEREGLGVAAQVGFARRQSHHRGKRFLGLAKTLRAEMPCTYAALRLGVVSERRATIMAKGTVFLSLEDRKLIDSEIAGDLEELSQRGDRELEALVAKRAYELDAETFVKRSRKAQADRRVTSRPAPDTMCHVTGLLPVAQGVAVMAALNRAADSMVAAGDGRSRGQIMADTLVERVTGLTSARPMQDPTSWKSTTNGEPPTTDPDAPAMPVTVNVVLSDRALFGMSDDPAQIEGHGPVPADVAREMILRSHAAGLAEIRRLYAMPGSGALVGMESRSRTFRGGLAAFVRLRDRTCRSPWCDAPVRHVDHAEPTAYGGATTATNGQGLCEACNYAKEAIGWSAQPRPGPLHTVETTTPTGHTYSSTAPAAPVHDATRAGQASRMELHYAELVLTA